MNNIYWFEQSATDVPPSNDWLAGTELARLHRLRVPKRRADWRLGRWTAKLAVAAYLNLPADPEMLAAIEIRAAATGAPEAFLGNQPADLTISLGHRAGVAVCVVAGPGAVLGCDLEIAEPRSDEFIADYFTADEQALIAAASPAYRDQIAALLWSAKESALKALQEGLRLDTRSVVARPAELLTENDDGDYWRPLQVEHEGGQVFYGWWQATGGFLRTLVAAAAPPPPVPLSPATSSREKAA
jgi:4'-phosphopantetheinyl transferase